MPIFKPISYLLTAAMLTTPLQVAKADDAQRAFQAILETAKRIAQNSTIPQRERSVVNVNRPVLNVARYFRGEFRRQQDGSWIEISYQSNTAAFRFREISNTGRKVHLFDQSRNIQIFIDVFAGGMSFVSRNRRPRPLYQITSFELSTGVIGYVPTPGTAFPPRPPVQQPRPPVIQNPTLPPRPPQPPVVQNPRPPAQPVDERRWQTFSTRSTPPRHILSYGVPETDAVSMRARCGIRSNGKVRLIAAINVGNRPNGTPMKFSFTTQGFSKVYQGRVVGVNNTQERISGIALRIDYYDPVWRELAGKNRVRINTGFGQQYWSLRGSSDSVRRFVNNCRSLPTTNVGNPQPPQQPQPPAPPQSQNGRQIACSNLGQIRSTRANRRANVTFVNRSGAYRALTWIDYNGQPKDYGGLNPGQTKTISSYVTHPWMVTNGPGDCREMFLPGPGNNRFVLRRRG